MYYGGGGAGFWLLAAVGGYWVLERAESHKGQLRRVGKLLGSIIIVLSLLGIVCGAWSACRGEGWSCPFGGKMKSQRWESKAITVPAAPAPETKRR
jgi:hypothetical protein